MPMNGGVSASGFEMSPTFAGDFLMLVVDDDCVLQLASIAAAIAERKSFDFIVDFSG
jgi:hypothetical protein